MSKDLILMSFFQSNFTICEDGVWRKTVNASSAAVLRNSITCSQIANMPLATVGTHGDTFKILREVVEATKTAVVKSNCRKIAL